MVGARFPVSTCVLVDRTLLGGCDIRSERLGSGILVSQLDDDAVRAGGLDGQPMSASNLDVVAVQHDVDPAFVLNETNELGLGRVGLEDRGAHREADMVVIVVLMLNTSDDLPHDESAHPSPHFFQQTGPMPRSTLIGSSSAAEHTPQMLVVLPTI